MTPEQVSTLVANMGFPIVVALGVGYMMWQLGKRVVDAHIRNLDKAGDKIEQVAKSMEDISDTQLKISVRMDQISREMQTICKGRS